MWNKGAFMDRISNRRTFLLVMGWPGPSIIEGVGHYVQERHYRLLVLLSYVRKVPLQFMNRADGVILMPGEAISPELTASAMAMETPKVLLSHAYPDSGLPRVIRNDYEAGWRAAEIFLDRGFREFLFVNLNITHQALLRMEGYRARIKQAGANLHEPLVLFKNSSEVVMAKLKALPTPLAVFGAFDEPAIELLGLCQDVGLRIPEDVSVMSFGNHRELVTWSDPPLSSLTAQEELLGYRAAALLDRVLDGEGLAGHVEQIPPGKFVERESMRKYVSRDPLVGQVLDYIHARSAEPLYSAAIAERFGVTVRTLQRRFRQHYSRTLGEEIHRARTGFARRQIQEGLHGPEIAEQMDFSSPQYFYKWFEAQAGISVKEYRNSLLEES
jgi:LacI family transcriptional regulator